MKIEKNWVFPSWIPKPNDVYEKGDNLVKVSTVMFDYGNPKMIVYWEYDKDLKHTRKNYQMEMYRFLRFVDRKVLSREMNIPEDKEKPKKDKRLIRM